MTTTLKVDLPDTLYAINALNWFITERNEAYLQAADQGDRSLAHTLEGDVLDAEFIRNGLAHGDTFEDAVEQIMRLDTEPRERILDHFRTAGLKDAVEATGFVTYAK